MSSPPRPLASVAPHPRQRQPHRTGGEDCPLPAAAAGLSAACVTPPPREESCSSSASGPARTVTQEGHVTAVSPGPWGARCRGTSVGRRSRSAGSSAPYARPGLRHGVAGCPCEGVAASTGASAVDGRAQLREPATHISGLQARVLERWCIGPVQVRGQRAVPECASATAEQHVPRGRAASTPRCWRSRSLRPQHQLGSGPPPGADPAPLLSAAAPPLSSRFLSRMRTGHRDVSRFCPAPLISWSVSLCLSLHVSLCRTSTS